MKTSHALLLLGAALGWAGHSRAQQPVPDAKTAYEQARESAAANYKAARAKCDLIAGNPHDLCVAEARAARVRVDEEAGAAYKNTLAAYTKARMRIASANYDRDKVRCAGLAGNDRDVCMEQAKAVLVAAQADAKADRKTIEARLDAREDKIAAEYRVALEKCDAFAGAAKDQCVNAAKAAFGK
ncbi:MULTISPECIES: hypothetical protein [unclassified Massilia]|uniref:hypothetical protein n=1 Tax=unclassified Massilia TaxID=2609279 RepID=UPI001B81C604|nr:MULTISPECIES: hypothetical protein [unclassified Massilia]MBQ5941707.1 hypothetical protein [Massilia sp. AB1]MBQ5962882.1 hypothetical protein [Massilia sp. ZL223]